MDLDDLSSPRQLATRQDEGGFVAVRPPEPVSYVFDPTLALVVSESAWVMRHKAEWLRARGALRRAGLVEDHGKRTHVLLIDSTGSRWFAHLHPTTTGSNAFPVPLPELPGGHYSVFADVVRADRLAETLVASVNLGKAPEVESAHLTQLLTTPSDGML